MTNALKHAPIDAEDMGQIRKMLKRQWTLEEIGAELGLGLDDLDQALWTWAGKKL